MIKIYEGEHNIEIEDHVEIDQVLEVMEKLDDVYKHRSEIVADLITIHKDILYYSLLYVLQNQNSDSIHIIKEGIKYWNSFGEVQQEKILEELIKEKDNPKIFDNEIEQWLHVLKHKN